MAAGAVQAQLPEAGFYPDEAPLLSPRELDALVGRIALYPDALLGIILPASTYPVQIVQAARFLQARQHNSLLEPSRNWDSSVFGLLNYSGIVRMMDRSLEWTTALGDAVIGQRRDVMDAIQQFRARAYAAGNLRSNSRQIIIFDNQYIIIESVDPEAIFVPRYDPRMVIVRRPVPPIIFYSDPYPLYYSPLARFYTGLFFGFGISFGIDWHSHHIHYRHHRYSDYHSGHKYGPNRKRFNINPKVWRPHRGHSRKRHIRPGTRQGERRSRHRDRVGDDDQTLNRFSVKGGSQFSSGSTGRTPSVSGSQQINNRKKGSGRVKKKEKKRSSKSWAFSGYGRGHTQRNYGNRGRESRSEKKKDRKRSKRKSSKRSSD